ncbi:MarR family winged helix-turn-helix transcriptional regulator [Marinoscillum sp. MHG1-6]|uniref:MarR family winged helix-turn-helix transcriptional regulator n=1 Tax=Marinoscillum sp. MHG1-6 TaxID=2959627 RepID=UPI002157CBB9|nr:MarR family transcriptional regulator [Marinoscillum sp. MHG1-6]
MGIAEDIKQKQFNSELHKAIVNIIYTNGWLHQKQSVVFKPHGLTTPQYNILRILRGQYPGPSTVNLLIDRMMDKSSNASRIVDKLEMKGLVERRQCSGDRRAVDVIISEEGLKLLEKIDNEMNEWEESVRNLSEEEFETLNNLLDKLRGC